MEAVIGLAFTAWLGWAWWSGHGIGRIAAWLLMMGLGSMVVLAMVPKGQTPIPGYFVLAIAAYVVSSVPAWLRRRRQSVDVRVEVPRNVSLQLSFAQDVVDPAHHERGPRHA